MPRKGNPVLSYDREGKKMMNKTGTQKIETERLTLRPFQPTDAEDMFNNWASDPEVTRFLTWPSIAAWSLPELY